MGKEYSPKEVATILGVNKRSVTLYLTKGILTGYKVSPRKWRVPEGSLLEYLESVNKKILGGVSYE